MLIDAERAGALLLELRESGRTIPELPDGLRPASWEEAYAIQDALHTAGGWVTAVLKVGCTGARAQEALGIAEPIGGRIPQASLFESGVALSLSDFHHPPLLECEFAFRLADDIAPDSSISAVGEVASLVDAMAPAIEVVDSRYHEMLGASGPSLVADNSVAAAVVIGLPLEAAGLDDLASCAVDLATGTNLLAEGSGAAVLGDPLRALDWAIRHELTRGRGIPAGTWVITGTCTGMTPCPVGQPVTATFERLGEVAFELRE